MYDFGDLLFGIGVLIAFAALVCGVIWLLGGFDPVPIDHWDKQFNGCYVHTTGSDEKHETKTLYCPSDIKVK